MPTNTIQTVNPIGEIPWSEDLAHELGCMNKTLMNYGMRLKMDGYSQIFVQKQCWSIASENYYWMNIDPDCAWNQIMANMEN